MFKKIILSFLLFVFHVSMCIANPIPVFCMFNYGIVKNSQEWSNIYTDKTTCEEYNRGSTSPFYDKKYVLKDNEIHEYNRGNTPPFYDKKYVLKDNEIHEYNRGNTPPFYDKKYVLKDNEIHEYNRGNTPPFYDKRYVFK